MYGTATMENNSLMNDQSSENKARYELSKEELEQVLDTSVYTVQIFKAVRNKEHKIIDFTWIMNNEKGINQNGDVIGKSLLMQNPGVVESGLFKTFCEITETGIPVVQEVFYNYEQFDGWYHQSLTKLNDGFVMHTKDITERKKAEHEVLRLKDDLARQAEDKYRMLFNSIDEGFCIIKILFDKEGKPFDYLVLEVNNAFMGQTGLADATGKTMREISAAHEEEWYQIYGRVALTGEPVRFEKEAGALGYYYDVYAFPIGKPDEFNVAVIFKDISARKQMEAELRQKDEKQKFLLKLSDTIRPEKSAVAIQETACRLLGEYLGVARVAYGELEPGSDTLVVSRDWSRPGISSIRGRYQTDDFGAFVTEALKNGQPVIVENAAADARISTAVYSNWQAIGVQSTIACPLIKLNGLVAVFFIHNDIPGKWKNNEVSLLADVVNRTWEAIERARTEEALKKSEEQYRTLFDSMDEGYCIIRMIYNDKGKAVDWIYLQVNRAFELNNGLHDAEGKTIKQMAPDIEEKWMEIYDKVAQTGEPLRFREDSKALHREFSLYAFRIGNAEERKVAVIFTDITQQSGAEAALRESEEQFRTLTQSLPQLIWTARADGYCNFFNDQWLDYTGAGFDEVKGDGWTNYINPEHKQRVFENWEKSLYNGTPVMNEFQLRDRNGNYNWFYAAGNPVKDPAGTITNWVGALTNIEGQKRAETKLQQLVDERTKELQQSNSDLQQFAHVASHDLSEPVRKIHMLLDRLQDEEQDTLSQNGKFYLNRIQSAANRMSNMIDGVLEYSVLTNIEKAAGIVDIEQIIKQVEEDLEVIIQQKNVQLHYNTLPIITSIDTLIYQLFYNLINNSIKFSKPDIPPVINITAAEIMRNGKLYNKITVTDNGIGFSPHDAENIFGSFKRLHSKDKYEGTGLGLALCRKIAERHGGTIMASGEKGNGAVFTIFLPAYTTWQQG